ncbi:MAG TPA: hypothetical protein VF245_09155 [Solirubrobacterales bacterium]
MSSLAKRRWGSLVTLTCLALAVTAPSASATFHQMSIREVYPGSAANPSAEYVELQMWSSGQNLVGGHVLRTYTAAGAPSATVLPSDVPNGASQSTILIATPAAETEFGVAADAPLPATDGLDPAGGAVCWEEIDCVAWGDFASGLPSPSGADALPAGIPNEMALRRTIAPGCATALEQADDRDDSATDFAAVFPDPRPNSVAPSEHVCVPASGPSGSYGGARAPQTLLRKKPPRRTHDSTPTFRFASDEPGSTFLCKLDRRGYKPCRSPFTTRRLSIGRHLFRVRARDRSGLLDPSPVSYRFRVLPG